MRETPRENGLHGSSGTGSPLGSRAVAWLLVVACGACSGEPLERVRDYTYPPDLHYITKQQIRTTMGALAAQVDALDEIMWQPGGPTGKDQARVVEILSQMRTLARELDPRAHSSHPRIEAHGARLRHDIERALAAARRAPPNYYYAGTVSGACTYCHEPRHRSQPR